MAPSSAPPASASPALALLFMDSTAQTDLPSDLSEYLSSAQTLLASFPGDGWGKPKVHAGVVDTFKTSGKPIGSVTADGQVWCARRSIHVVPEGYQAFKNGLLIDHAKHESEYIPALKEIRLVDSLNPADGSYTAQIWSLDYHLPRPLSPRNFVILFLGIETIVGEEFINISIPVETGQPSENVKTGSVRGRYVSVERVRLTGHKENEVEWVMALASTPGGAIPQFITNSSLPGEISKDVGYFLKWLENRS
ncbi:START-like domain [Phaffia rhodozyma]|uniref:START-like domain n=1 Tax=Phaffia rhodozyma TaxID=264483 RepID=A0A0F7SR86_PHARH|nr:START-like domain [Phaffia rhodozyma]